MFYLHRSTRQIVLTLMLLAFCVQLTHASDDDAVSISNNIQKFHMPYDTVLDPVFASSDPNSPDFSRIVSYSRAGDSAIWTGHYLAAEAFRYRVTGSDEALKNAWRALRGIRSLLDITGTDVLARCLVPVDSPFASDIQRAEAGHGIFFGKLQGRDYFWIGNTSRDQYSGVMLGLSTAYDLIDDPAVQSFIKTDVTRMLNFLLRRGWSVVMPNGAISTTFWLRPDQELSFLQIGRKINPQAFGLTYAYYRNTYASSVGWPIAYDNIDDHNHYFKFNLNYINLYDLIRLEEDTSPFKQTYLDAYNALRGRTRTHGNAHFNMMDRALVGPNAARDSETINLLALWLVRSRRDHWVDLRGKYPPCLGQDRSCVPIPVNVRINTDFLWQRSPYLLYGGGFGTIETAAIDYILPYWMARSFGL
jgi:hypothetical protein